MMTILAVYVAIGVAEWSYLRRNRRKNRTYIVLAAVFALLLAASETLYALRERFHLCDGIEAIFGPIDRLFVGK